MHIYNLKDSIEWKFLSELKLNEYIHYLANATNCESRLKKSLTVIVRQINF
jgi:hypothetical protein